MTHGGGEAREKKAARASFPAVTRPIPLSFPLSPRRAPSDKPAVLLPGSGMGRIVFEAARAGARSARGSLPPPHPLPLWPR